MFKRLLRYKIIGLSYLASLLLAGGGWLWALLALQKISGPLVIHFNGQGINQIGGLAELSEIGIIGLLIIAANFFISLELEEKERFLGRALAAATLFISILIFIGFAAIISVN